MDLDHLPADRRTPIHSARPVTSDDPIHFRDRPNIDFLSYSQTGTRVRRPRATIPPTTYHLPQLFLSFPSAFSRNHGEE